MLCDGAHPATAEFDCSNIVWLNGQPCAGYERFKEQLAGGQFIAFIGSGVSRRIYGQWHELVAELCTKCGVDHNISESSTPSELLEAAERAKANRSQYEKYLVEKFASTGVVPELLRPILRCGFRSFITINFDYSLQREVSDYKYTQQYSIRKFPDRLNPQYVSQGAAFYIHGLITRDQKAVSADDIVLAASDFKSAYSDTHPSKLRTFLDYVLSDNPVCFIGCSLDEPPLQNVLRACKEYRLEIETKLDSTRPPHFILRPLPKEARAALIQTSPSPMDQCKARAAIQKESSKYEALGIEALFYDEQRADHFGLLAMFERIANFQMREVEEGFASGGGPTA